MKKKIMKLFPVVVDESEDGTIKMAGFDESVDLVAWIRSGPKLDPPNLPIGYTVLRRAEEGVDAIWQKGGFRVFVGWDTSHVYLPALSVAGRAMRGPVIGYRHELEMFEKIYGAV